MKRVMALIVALMLLTVSLALAEDMDLTAFTDEELNGLEAAIAAERESREAAAAEVAAAAPAETVQAEFPLKRGSRGDNVKALQEALRVLEYATGRADGIFGQKTENAVKAFQADNGLTDEGIVAEELFDVIIKKADYIDAEKIEMFDFSTTGAKEAVTQPNGMVYTPMEGGTFTLQGDASAPAVIGIIPSELPPLEAIPTLPTIITLEAGQTYLISGLQLVCLPEEGDQDLVIINACRENRLRSTALMYEPKQNLRVQEIRVWYDKGTVSEGTYEPSIVKLEK